jgi:hypothetical protein
VCYKGGRARRRDEKMSLTPIPPERSRWELPKKKGAVVDVMVPPFCFGKVGDPVEVFAHRGCVAGVFHASRIVSLIHRSAWKKSSANFALRGFSEVRYR